MTTSIRDTYLPQIDVKVAAKLRHQDHATLLVDNQQTENM